MAQEKTNPEKLTFEQAINQVNSELVKKPHALSVGLSKIEGKSVYAWTENDNEARVVRKNCRRILRRAFQDNALNYQKIADALRVDLISVQALIDEDWQFRYPNLKS